jgi:hypothetical protein
MAPRLGEMVRALIHGGMKNVERWFCAIDVDFV